MKILFVTDFPLSNDGGSQKSSSFWVDYGKKLGHEIKIHNYNSSPINLIEKYDLVISSNLEIFYNQKQFNVLNFLINHPKHVRVERDSCLYMSEAYRKNFFQSTIANIFLTNYHLSYFQKDYGDYFLNNKIVYSYVDDSVFYDNNSKKEFELVYAGFIHPLKGYENLLNHAFLNSDKKITVFGWGDESLIRKTKQYKNIEFKGKASHDELPDIFRLTENIFHKPIVKEPFCRMTAEAMMCGAGFVGFKDKIGSVIEVETNGIEDFSKKCSNACKEFWDTLETL